ncbi:MAG: OmpA family protein [Deltaproteobacteria bacterium]|jgi:chemotaxis protein MotB|nr:OmpA family protein [Deltaproteobacteria bacterium]
MAVKRQPQDDEVDTSYWMLTFSDMVTLLLTFFVMIISITSIEPKSLAEIPTETQIVLTATPARTGPGSLGFSNPRLLAPLIELIERLDQLPLQASLDQDEIRAALFQLDPADPVSYQRLERQVSEAVSVFKDERGLVIRWDRSVVFPEGSTVIREDAALLLGRLAGLLSSLTQPVSLECHTNPFSDLEGGDGPEARRLSARRAKIVLELLTAQGVPESRFRLGAFGGARPLTDDPARAAENARLEVVIYNPPKSSWKG